MNEECGYVTLPDTDSLLPGSRVPLDACMKLEMEKDEWLLYTCYNNSVYKETFTSDDCRESSITNSTQFIDYYDFVCGLGGNCNYIQIYKFDSCDGAYFEDIDEQIPKGNYIHFMEI